MIPSIEEILSMYAKGECTLDQALQWIGTSIDSAVNREVLRDTFASMAAIGRDEKGNLLETSVMAVMGRATPPEGLAPLAAMQWWCKAEARIRYMKAEAMLEARCL